MKIKNIVIVSMSVFALLIGSFLGITSLVSAQEAASEANPSASALSHTRALRIFRWVKTAFTSR